MLKASGLYQSILKTMNNPAASADAQSLADWAKIKGRRVMDTAKHNWNLRGTPDANVQVRTKGNDNFVDVPQGAKDVGRGERVIGYAAQHPIYSGMAVAGGYLADQFLGAPIGGSVDALTLGLTNFRPDTRGETFGDAQSVPYSVPYAQGTALDANNNIVPNAAAPVPPLNDEELAYEIKRQRRYIAANSITLRELERMQKEKQGYFV